MKKYIKPTMDGQLFAANEYVGACWGVGCDTVKATEIENGFNNRPYGGHRASECGRFDQQAVVTTDNGVPIGMVELDTYWGNLQCEIYTDSSYATRADASFVRDIDQGDTIYWITRGGSYVYHHVGTVQGTIENRPNAS